MAKKPEDITGIEWNQVQLKIAYLLDKGMEPIKIIQKEGFPKNTTYKVVATLAAGFKPPSLDPEFIKNAKKPTKFVKKNTGEQTPAKEDGKEGQEEGDVKVSKAIPPKTTAASQTAILQFVTKIQPIAMTPDIYMSYMCAVKNGYELSLAEWISLVARDFWLGRERNFYAEAAEYSQSQQEAKVG